MVSTSTLFPSHKEKIFSNNPARKDKEKKRNIETREKLMKIARSFGGADDPQDVGWYNE